MNEPTLEQIGELAVTYRRLVLDEGHGESSPIAREARRRLFAAIDRVPALSRVAGGIAYASDRKPSLELAIFMVRERSRREAIGSQPAAVEVNAFTSNPINGGH